jgi:hypothetical protein
VAFRWFSTATPVSSTNKTDSHDITWLVDFIVLNATFTQQYFSYIVAVSCIGGGNRRKPPTYRKLLPIFIA